MTALVDLVPALKRGVAVPGGFAEHFPTTTDADLTGMLADAYAAARLDGFLDETTLEQANFSVSPDLTVADAALVTLYATVRMTRTLLLNRPGRSRVKAGPVESEEDIAATVLVELLKQANATLTRLQERGPSVLGDTGTTVTVSDAYEAMDTGSYGPPWMLVQGGF